MRDIFTAFILGLVLANSMHLGIDDIHEGGWVWILELIVFPAAALVGLISLLWTHRKRASAEDRHPHP
ncbi:hypothetical protein ACH82I_05995 [Brevibacterium sp. GP-SGM9]|uniref:hypothetical protein n=1 Tax=unclassified Brevibacterium TaxID=2614124 RepID=UPI001E3C8A98|nr:MULTISPECIES: hypothetical protein [unclassified Brevibacterium]MCD1287099.1 hypothetical protein [Brevibacterium sp. CCUG 69071]MDK8436327.1 hypothetical protein [Brevibacterium sp. H-BE7]